jgi:hypothetical protein
LMSDEEIVRITNDNFVTITRDGIEGKMDIIVDVSSAEEDNLKAQELSFMLQTIGPNADWGITSKVMSEIARLRKMPELAHDIANYKPQPSPVEVAREKAEIRKLEAEAAEAEAKVKTEQARALLYVAQARAAGSKADLQDLQFIEQESGTTHVRDMAQIEAQGEANQDLTITKALVEQGDLNAAIGFTQLTKSR